MAEIGRQAGVARETVSAVFNGRERQCRIAPETSARVRAIARQLIFRPQPAEIRFIIPPTSHIFQENNPCHTAA
ncbi:MAG: LacI family DNA-binding transcriptional regulator [Phycisphaeraceae bacterium]|nr:LacI family DNA-binding transcriptional regulator [Phycisphaeraceae bacterium]